MSYVERIYFIHNPEGLNNSVRISLLDRDWSAMDGASEVDSDADIFQLTYDEQPSILSPFIASSLTAIFDINDATLINDLAGADDKRFVLAMRIGLDEVWRGGVVPGVISYVEDESSIAITAACGINLLETRFFNPVYGLNVSAYQYISDSILGDFKYAIPWDSVRITNKNALLENIKINAWPFYQSDDNSITPIRQRDILENILKRFNSRLFKWDGWKVESLDGSGTAFKDATGTQARPSNLPVTDTDWDNGLIAGYLPSIGGSNLKYKHQSSSPFNKPIPEQAYSVNSPFRSNAIQVPRFKGRFSLAGTAQANSTDIFNSFANGYARLQIAIVGEATNGEIYRFRGNNTTYAWVKDEDTTSIQTNFFDIVSDNILDGSEDVVDISFKLGVLPAPVFFESLTYELKGVQVENQSGALIATADRTTYSGVKIEFTGVENDLDLYALATNNATQNINYGELKVGDLVEFFTPSAIKDLTSDVRTELWTNAVHAGAEDINNLTLRTLLGYSNGIRSMLRGTLLREYRPDQLITYEGKTYRFEGGTLTADGYWTGTWIELRFVDPTPTFKNYANFNLLILGRLTLPY